MRLLFSIVLFFMLNHSTAQQLVMRGDHADPSVVKIGDLYWASATTSNWFPAYPLMYSSDLINWKNKGYVFTKKPDWADFYFWAPEISYENGKVYIYYSAHKKDGNLCLSVASADKPEGPYTDHGPLMCEVAGSIDAFPMRDENGKLFMIWKEDGNSVNKPTPIWAQEMNEERTALLGEKKELFRNTKSWEGRLVEGVSMMKIGEYYYAFYAAAGCCGIGCDYKTGVARSKKLLGPWEKYDRNPILKDNGSWKCPGHGTPIVKDGKYYFLYHAYDTASSIFTGRQGLLQEFNVTNDNWIEFTKAPAEPAAPLDPMLDRFDGRKLNEAWQWSVFQTPVYNLRRGKLTLQADNKYGSGTYLGVKALAANYVSGVTLNTKKSTAASGIAAIGDDQNTISLLYHNNNLRLVQQREGKDTLLGNFAITTSKSLHLRITVTNSRFFTFSYSNNGASYKTLNEKPVDGSFLPPWDRALRIGIVSRGSTSQQAVFDEFQLVNN
jgi:xylan 1,4-beta-xylosidase